MNLLMIMNILGYNFTSSFMGKAMRNILRLSHRTLSRFPKEVNIKSYLTLVRPHVSEAWTLITLQQLFVLNTSSV